MSGPPCSFIPARDCGMGSVVSLSFSHALKDDQIWKNLLKVDYLHRVDLPTGPDGTDAGCFRSVRVLTVGVR